MDYCLIHTVNTHKSMLWRLIFNDIINDSTQPMKVCTCNQLPSLENIVRHHMTIAATDLMSC